MLVVAAKTKGLFEKEVDDLMAVARAVGLATHVNPINLTVGGFFDELIEVGIIHKPQEPLIELLEIGKRLSISAPAVISRKPDIYRLTRKVLTARGSPEGLIKRR